MVDLRELSSEEGKTEVWAFRTVGPHQLLALHCFRLPLTLLE